MHNKIKQTENFFKMRADYPAETSARLVYEMCQMFYLTMHISAYITKTSCADTPDVCFNWKGLNPTLTLSKLKVICFLQKVKNFSKTDGFFPF
jgi:hypothetical protein